MFRTAINKTPVSPPLCILQTPFTPGAKWRAAANVAGQATDVTFVAKETEEVEVPAGKYKAARVEGDGKVAGTDTKITYWFAPGVGIVKLKYQLAGGEAVLELKSFTPGKE